MTRKVLPSIQALEAPSGATWEAPSGAFQRWEPVKAALSDEPNTININDQIGESFDGTGVTARLVGSILRKAKGEDVVVNINSPGGDFFEGVTIYNMLREHDGAVNVNVLGLAASAASIIAMAADDLKIAKSAFLMIHNSWGLVMGNQNDMRQASETFAVFDKSMAGVYSDRTGIPTAKIAALMDADTWMDGETAVADGFADGFLASDDVIEDEEQAANAKHKIDVILAKQGVSRSERRKMLSEIASTQNAAGTATQDAGDSGLIEALSQFVADTNKEPAK